MAPPSLQQRLHQALHQPLDAAALAVFRILFGGLMFVGTLRFMSCGWIEKLYLEPSFHFKYWGFEWVTVPGEVGLYLLYSGIAVSALLVALGAFYRIAIIAFWCLFTYAELMDVSNYLNHYYFTSLIALILCFLSPHRTWSVDAWRNPSLHSDTLPAWQTWWLRFQVGLLYFYAGLAKFEPDWLLHAQPLNIWLPPLAGMPLLGPLLDQVWVHYLFSWFAFFFDTFIIAFMLVRRTRPYAFAVIVTFHLFTHLFFNIGLFPFIMVFAVLVFFEPDWPRQWLRRIGRDTVSLRTAHNEPGHWNAGNTLAALAVAGFCAFQFLFPLRQWAYPGSVLWHEQGMRFSWRVMLREKSGTLEYRVTSRDGTTRLVSPHDYLTEQQYREMSGQPDLILQLAHRIRDDYNARGFGPVQVRADSRVSLNGRAAARLIDPDVDLAAVADGLAVAHWILPQPSESPRIQKRLELAHR